MSDISNLGCRGAVELHHAVVYFHAQTARPACPRVVRERGPNPGFDDGIASVAVQELPRRADTEVGPVDHLVTVAPRPPCDGGSAEPGEVSDATHGRDRSQTTAPVNRRSGQK
jgi:hypothetical protein